MKRIHKYRAWIPNDYFELDGELGYTMTYDLAFEDYAPINDLLNGVEFLMEFTGVQDKNGVDIYEDDIVNGCMFNGSYAYGKVEFYKGRYIVVPIGRFLEGCDEVTNSHIEVIGNIHENPELLGE
jgi:uncharacterized phage protein (TIGR01671 family)